MFVKPILEQLSIKNQRKLCQFKTTNKYVGTIILKTKKYDNKDDMFVTLLLDEKNNILGKEIFDITGKSLENMFGYTIKIERNARGKKLGELLRLSTIIEMIENRVETLKIYSKNTAIFFHDKYGFEPAIKQFTQRDEILKEIANCKICGFNDLKRKAQNMLDQIKNIPIQNGQYHREKCKETNKLLKQFIERIKATNNIKNIKFETGIDMNLTKDTVLKRRNFFNSLFKEHNIDYKVAE